jgi:hypothetical protein
MKRHGTLNDIGSWPTVGCKLREYPHFFYHVPEEKKLLAIAGVENPVLMKFCVSNDYVHVGEIILPAGGKGVRMTDVDSHEGECLLYMENGPLTVFFTDYHETFYVGSREAVYIPKNTKYQILNYEAKTVTVVFAITEL